MRRTRSLRSPNAYASRRRTVSHPTRAKTGGWIGFRPDDGGYHTVPGRASPRPPRRHRGGSQKAVLARLVPTVWLRRSGRPMARPVAHHPGREWGPRTTVRRCGPLRADTQPATPREGPKERPRTRKLTAGGYWGRPDAPRRSPRPSGRGGRQPESRPLLTS